MVGDLEISKLFIRLGLAWAWCCFFDQGHLIVSVGHHLSYSGLQFGSLDLGWEDASWKSGYPPPCAIYLAGLRLPLMLKQKEKKKTLVERLPRLDSSFVFAKCNTHIVW